MKVKAVIEWVKNHKYFGQLPESSSFVSSSMSSMSLSPYFFSLAGG